MAVEKSSRLCCMRLNANEEDKDAGQGRNNQCGYRMQMWMCESPSIGDHAPGQKAFGFVDGPQGEVHPRDLRMGLTACRGRTVVWCTDSLTKRKCLCSVELGTTALFDASKTTFTRFLVFLRAHGDVVLRRATESIVCEKGAVASIKDVNLRVSQVRVAVHITSSVTLPNVFGPGSG